MITPILGYGIKSYTPYFKGVQEVEKDNSSLEIVDKMYDDFIMHLRHKNVRASYSKDSSLSKSIKTLEKNEGETKKVIGLLYEGLKDQYSFKKSPNSDIAWKPVMSEDEAELFIKNSETKRTLYRSSKSPELHKKNGYTLDRVNTMYPGVYLATNKRDAELYGPNPLPLKANIRNSVSYNAFKIREENILNKGTSNIELKNAFCETIGVLENILAKEFNIGAFMNVKEVFEDLYLYYAVIDPKNIVILAE